MISLDALLNSYTSETTAYKRIDTTIHNKIAKIKERYRGSHMVSALHQEEPQMYSKLSCDSVVPYQPDGDVEDDTQHRSKPSDKSSYCQMPYGFGVTEGLIRSAITKIG